MDEDALVGRHKVAEVQNPNGKVETARDDANSEQKQEEGCACVQRHGEGEFLTWG